MSNLTIGRIGIDLDVNPTDMQLSGNKMERKLQVAGEVALADPDDAIALRNQLWEIEENADLILPITWVEDPTIDGYYFIDNARLDLTEASMSGYYPFKVSATRLGSSGKVAIESKLTVGLRANAHSITTAAEPIFGLPQGAVSTDHYADPMGWAVGATVSRIGENGTVKVMRGVPLTQKSFIYGLPASAYYDGAAAIEFSNGTTWVTVPGLDCPNEPANLRLTNDLLRFTLNATNGRIEIAHYDGAAWDAERVYIFSAGAIVSAWKFVSVIRNDPGAVTIRLVQQATFGFTDPVYLDVTVRRGSRLVEFRGSVHSDGTAVAWKIRNVGTVASTSITGGVRDTSNDAAGNRSVLMSSTSVTDDLVNGAITSASLTSWDFAIGWEIGGTGAQAGDTAADLVDQYHGYLTETIGPVMR